MKVGSTLPSDPPLWRNGVLYLCLALACILTLSGCADGKEAPADRTAMLPEDQRVSTVPWNKPQGWENQGALGSLANDPRFGGQTQP
jgi:hypothetical protein